MNSESNVAVVGAGPAGLMAAEVIAQGGVRVTVFDRMPAAGRKFLLAGRGGLNLTHSEPLNAFLGRYGAAMPDLREAIEAFPPGKLRAWCEELGQETFLGSSGRVFPKSLKASPLLRAWLRRLDATGVAFKPRHRWTGWVDAGGLTFETPSGVVTEHADAVVLALGGASWPRLGSDGSWVEIMRRAGIAVRPLRPANAGVLVDWSEIFRDRFEGEPLKRIALTLDGQTVRGEAMVTRSGLEGGAIYALSAAIRDAIAATGETVLRMDLRPDLTVNALKKKLNAPRGKQSLSTFLRKAASLAPAAIKAISTAGGLAFDAIDAQFMLRQKPGTFVAGEMLDWEAPTGGYLLQACFATGVAAGQGALRWSRSRR